MATTVRLPITRLFAPITRVDKEKRIVEGFCYTKAKVGDGYNLKRSTMEVCTPDYLEWGAVREMHNPSAVGTAKPSDKHKNADLGIFWKPEGALIRAYISDDNAWKKVCDEVYKGFSVGVKPLVVRGEDVETARWVENSLVDRPADDGARITIYRADGSTESEDSLVDVIRYEAGEELPAEVKAEISRKALDFRQTKAANDYEASARSHVYRTIDTLHQSIHSIGRDPDLKPAKRDQMCRAAFAQAADHLAPIVAGTGTDPGVDPDLRADNTTLTRSKPVNEEEIAAAAAAKAAEDLAAAVAAAATAATGANETGTEAERAQDALIQRALDRQAEVFRGQLTEQQTAITAMSAAIGALAGDVSRLSSQPIRYHAVKFPTASQDGAAGVARTMAHQEGAASGGADPIKALSAEIDELKRSAQTERDEAKRMTIAQSIAVKKTEMATLSAIAALQ